MNIHIKSYLLGLAFCGVALTSCESFDSINLNPNDPTPENRRSHVPVDSDDDKRNTGCRYVSAHSQPVCG